MPYTPTEKRKAAARVRRIQGQVEALGRMLDGNAPCSDVLQQIAALRGAVNGLMSSVLESHLRESLAPVAPQETVDDAIGLVRSYLK
ncbi:metal/formaldehyde-sensitive transcriptional repressor [Kerstersia sp.]|uniref:metal/formaldehyde-sensitive transcriptional repressor n=1 Tax=Kerstersia sp. TaxID=1930783 RepID=UPI003F921DE7